MKRYLTALFFLTSIFFSCQKEINVEINTPTNSTTNTIDSSYISEIVWTDSTANRNVFKTQKFQYDNSKRLIGSTISRTFDTLKYTFSYNSNDTLPNKMILIHSKLLGQNNNIPAKDTTILYYFFDQSGSRIKDSTLNYSNSIVAPGNIPINSISLTVVKYTYSANKIFGFIRDTTLVPDIFTPQYPASYAFDTAVLDGNKNMLLVNFRYASNSSSDYFENYNLQYDSKPSPYLRFQKFRPELIPFNMDTDTYETLWSTNNLTKLDYTSGFGGSPSSYIFLYDLRNLYIYNTNNYPKLINSSPFFGQYVNFKYIAL